MVVFKSSGYVVKSNSILDILDDILHPFEPPIYGKSSKWKNWIAVLDLKTCYYCRKQHGTIYPIDDLFIEEKIPVHICCRCKIEPVPAILAGRATKDGQDGVDYWLKYLKRLPDYYISKQEAKKLGWQDFKGNLDEVAPGKKIGGDIYQNREGRLPDAPGRIWYEADINYDKGYRNSQRIIYSNDGLIFVTYDHY